MTSNPHFEGNPDLFYCDKNLQKTKIYPGALSIVWGNDGRYWKPIKQTKPSYADGEMPPAELIQVNWLEVTGSVEVKRNRRYSIQFQVSLTQDAFGWGNSPVYFMAKRDGCSKSQVIWRKCSLSSMTAGRKIYVPGNLVIDSGNALQLQFGLYEVWTGKWKGGLKIHHVLVEPAAL
ncbi:PREDICTED: protein PHLOEM PROTEIN 2-LIKE A9-like [Ipomoea nil]|uniref:protein PHLOEM PROTEIN 2-LIKE A9-like n=1 Tax=Ipomoea nil TaxID=35883 RepID=UPI00090175C3|nr:PREDICTED: protein PHLOEM PROTEIN 2-LIKE A9-like [Ipomoea nil]